MKWKTVLLVALLWPWRGGAVESQVVPPEPIKEVLAKWPQGYPSSSNPMIPLLVWIDAEGKVKQVESQDTSLDPALVTAARVAASQWEFKPALQGAKPVGAKIRLVIQFESPPLLASPSPSVSDAASFSSLPQDQSDEEYHINVRSKRGRESVAAGDMDIKIGQLGDVPRQSAEGMLRLVPGLVLTSHSGQGHASSMFMRGFDVGEGQNIEFQLEGIPLNQPLNPHGHGYADSHLIIPELLQTIHVIEGPFDPRQGDFAVAGSMNYQLGMKHRGLFAKSAYGSFDTRRLVVLWGSQEHSNRTVGGIDFTDSKGFGLNRKFSEARTIAQYEHTFENGTVLTFLGLGYVARFDSAGVIREDDVATRRMPCAADQDSQFFCLYDSNQGGITNWHGFSMRLSKKAKSYAWGNQVFLNVHQLRFRHNFTGFLHDKEVPGGMQRGDGNDQLYQATTVGGRGHYTLNLDWRGGRHEVEVGYFMRYDSGTSAQRRLRFDDGSPYRIDFSNQIGFANLGLYGAGRFIASPWLVLRGGLRVDTFGYSIINQKSSLTDALEQRLAPPSSDALAMSLEPRASGEVILTPCMSWVTSAGVGVRSADAKGMISDAAPAGLVYATETGVVANRRTNRQELLGRLAGFYTRVTQDQMFDEEEGRAINIGTSHRFGMMAMMRWIPWWGLDTQASLAYSEAYLSRSEQNPLQEMADHRLLYIPQWTARADASLRRSLPMTQGKLHYTLACGTSYITPRSLPFDQRSLAFWSVDVAGKVRWKWIEMGIEMTNLLDRRNQQFIQSYPSNFQGPEAFPSRLVQPHFAAGPPRTILGTLTLYWDPLPNTS
ncbi:TonB-dependent receptor domain-containing protein [Pajaroellobacter abortibovis]|uniref:TonB-dependent receptor n=1 Tax=Pajaroellobacter abortibovis TaxID=1882918 RepID=A0A1L6MV57_9BACT|nr:TonB-dependent receptor [Pajaroellobacter abortibovis]APR99335.1 hypothetical protein BCY86_00565 [Pajaroellobacter abortibovis]